MEISSTSAIFLNYIYVPIYRLKCVKSELPSKKSLGLTHSGFILQILFLTMHLFLHQTVSFGYVPGITPPREVLSTSYCGYPQLEKYTRTIYLVFLFSWITVPNYLSGAYMIYYGQNNLVRISQQVSSETIGLSSLNTTSCSFPRILPT